MRQGYGLTETCAGSVIQPWSDNSTGCLAEDLSGKLLGVDVDGSRGVMTVVGNPPTPKNHVKKLIPNISTYLRINPQKHLLPDDSQFDVHMIRSVDILGDPSIGTTAIRNRSVVCDGRPC